MKKRKLFTWVLLLAAFGMALFIGLHFLGGRFGHEEIGAWQNKASQMQAFHRGSGGMGGQMMQQGRGFHHGGMMMNGPRGARHFAGGHGFGMGGILFALGAILLGWLFRKNAGEVIWRKWVGWLLIGIGALVLFAKVLPLIVLAVIAVVIYRFVKGKKKGQLTRGSWSADEVFEPVAPISSSTGKMLDEWERNINKEDK